MVAGLLAAMAGLYPAMADDEGPEDLPEGKGREETFYACTACHGLAIIRQQGMSRERWEATIEDMRVRHNMPELEAADRALVAEYLGDKFPPRTRGRANPFLNR